MAYQFPPDLDERVKALLEKGPYQSEDELLREAVDALERRQQGLEQLRAMVQEADEDIVAGRVKLFDAEETKRVVRERLAQNGIKE